MSKTRIYNTWFKMKKRCFDPKSKDHRLYGERGIKVCKRWNKFENFRDDMYESYLEHVQKYGENQTSLDRIDNNGNYRKENCRWATWREQNLNSRRNVILEIKGKKLKVSEWADISGIDQNVINWRIKNNWPIEKAIFTKPKK